MQTNKKGFTLIELLVVIAIIGILSGLIVVSMNGAQNAAKDARIKATMDQMRATAEIHKLNSGAAGYGTYAGITTCNDAAGFIVAGSDGEKLCDAIMDTTMGSGAMLLHSSADKYCFSKVLNVSGSWCVDSSGYSGSTANCDGTPNYNCQ